MSKDAKLIIGGVVVLVVIALLGYNYLGSNPLANYTSLDYQAVPAAQLHALYNIANNVSLANRVGQGAVGSFPKRVNGTAMTFQGKPGLLFIGADYCPFCAATRWGLILAMMRFGNFTQLHYTSSFSGDVFPNTATFTFYNSTYTSGVLGFAHVELTNNTKSPLQQPNASQNATFYAYSTSGSIPFIDFGNRSIQSGSIMSPGVLANKNWNQIIAQLNNTNSTISQSVIGSADVFTVQICRADGNMPASVCSAPYVQRIISNGG